MSPTSFAAIINSVHLLWGIESIEENRLTRLDWKYIEFYGGKHLTLFGIAKFLTVTVCGILPPICMISSEFYKMIGEQNFNQNSYLQKSFHFVPFIACVHVFSTSKR